MNAKPLLLAVGLCLLFTAGLSTAKTASPGDERSQEPRPKFYAKEVLDHVSVVDPENVLGEADGRCTEIRPGGEMTVLMESRIYYSDSSDEGTVVTKGEGRYGLAGLFTMNEEGEPAWQPLSPGGTPGGFKLGPIMFAVAQSIDTIRIVNDDTRSVLVDAVIGFRRDERR